MTVVPIDVAASIAEEVLGGPVGMEVLKDKPGRRRTLRARCPNGSAIVKTYASDRAATVAERLAALAGGPREPVVPTVLHLDRQRRLVILSDVPGNPLRVAVVAGELGACRRAGAALASWHGAWAGRDVAPLRPHTIDRELAILRERATAVAPKDRAAGAWDLDPALRRPWPCSTVVHRDLYEEQLLTGPLVGLIDLDDVHLGPPELDVGNLLGHLALLDRREGSDAGAAAAEAVLAGYAAGGGRLDHDRLVQCERLSELRLGLIHRIPV